MKRSEKVLLTVQAAVFVLVLVCLYAFPGAPVLPTMLKLLGVMVVAVFCYRKSRYASIAGEAVLTAAFALLSVGMVVNVWYFTTCSGGTLEAPVLLNDDASVSWRQMMAAYVGESDMGFRMRGYGMVLAFLSLPGPPSIDNLLIFNLLFALLCLVLTSVAAGRFSCLPVDSAKALTAWTMGLLAAVCYFLASGTFLIKDMLTFLTFAAFVYALSLQIEDAPHRWAGFALALIAMAVASLVRPLLDVFMVGFAAAALLFIRHRVPTLIFIGVVAVIFIFYCSNSVSYVITETANTCVPIEDGSPERLQAYGAVAGDYNSLSMWQKVVRLPFSLAVQYLTPLPWAFARDVVFGPTQAYAHVAYPWYAVGGVALYYLFFCLGGSPRPLAILFMCGLAATVATALFTGGTISRYALLWLPSIVPGAAWVMSQGLWRRRSFAIWAVCYVLVMALALLTVFFFLNKYSPGGWEAR